MESIGGESRFFRALRYLALVGVMIAGLWACAVPSTPTDSYELVLDAPGLKSARPQVVVLRDEYSQIVERSTWNASHATWPQAELIFWRIKDSFRHKQTYIHESSLPEFIGIFLPGENITLGSVGTAENELGDLEWQRFTRSQFAECIFIEQGISRFSDQVDVIGSGEPLGDMVIRGWYCVGSTEPNQDTVFQGFIAGIGIRGWALPGGIATATLGFPEKVRVETEESLSKEEGTVKLMAFENTLESRRVGCGYEFTLLTRDWVYKQGAGVILTGSISSVYEEGMGKPALVLKVLGSDLKFDPTGSRELTAFKIEYSYVRVDDITSAGEEYAKSETEEKGFLSAFNKYFDEVLEGLWQNKLQIAYRRHPGGMEVVTKPIEFSKDESELAELTKGKACFQSEAESLCRRGIKCY